MPDRGIPLSPGLPESLLPFSAAGFSSMNIADYPPDHVKGITMKTLNNFKLLALSLLIVTGLAACNKPGPAESAGKSLDQAASDAGKKMGEAADKVSASASEQSNKAGVEMDDAGITSKIKAAIFAEPGLKSLQISVDTVKGVVTLTGSVDSAASSDRAKALASAVAGVKDVDNRLQTAAAK